METILSKRQLQGEGIDLDKGATDRNDDSVVVKQSILSSAGKIYLAVDSTKFGKVAFSKICSLSKVHVVVTDKKPDAAWLEAFEKMGIKFIYAE
mgnify:CR=1 FL=1